MEHEEHAEELEREADKLDEHAEEVGEDIDDARREWKAKEDDPSVPGAQPDPADEDAMSGNRGSDHSPGVPGEEDTGTGNPDAAGADEEDSSGA
jgi:hypothetical protein